MVSCKAERCRREIVWGTTQNGRPIPLDPIPERRVVLLRPDCPADPEDCGSHGGGL